MNTGRNSQSFGTEMAFLYTFSTLKDIYSTWEVYAPQEVNSFLSEKIPNDKEAES